MTNDYGNLELHTVLLSAMKDIDKICRENGLRYYLHAGTLLGAMNHKGFIPWDDDVDISFMRDDYERFLKIVQEQYSDLYFVDNYKTNPSYRNNRSVLRVLGTEVICFHDDGRTHREIGLDIVPLDAAPDSMILRKIQKTQIWIYDVAVQIKYSDIIPRHLATKCIGLLAKMSRTKLGDQIDAFSTRYNKMNTKFVGLLTYCTDSPFNGIDGYEDNLAPREWYEHPAYLPFEDTQFMAISKPQAELDRRYPHWRDPYPEEKRITKHDVKSYSISEEVRKRVGL